MRRQPRRLAGFDVVALEVAAIGDDVDRLDIQNGAGRFSGLFQQAHIDDLIGHRLLDDQLVFGVDSDLNVVADGDLGMGGHRPAVRIGQRHLSFATVLQLLKHRRIASALVAQRCDLLSQIIRPRAAARSAFLDIALVEPLEIVVQSLVRRADELRQRIAREIAILVVDCLDAGSVDRQQLAPKKFEPPAQQHELAKHRFERAAIVAPEVGDRLEIWLQGPQQPDDLDVAITLRLQPTARPNTVQIAVDVEFQKIARGVSGPPGRLGLDARKSRRCKVEPIDEGVDETHRIVSADIIVHRLRQQQKLITLESRDVSHARF